MTNIKRIKGTLTPGEQFGVSRYTTDKINETVNVLGFVSLVQRETVGERGVIVIYAHTLQEKLSITDFARRLTEALHMEGVKELELKGTLNVSVDEDPYEYRVTVQGGKISHHPAT